jgi:hypothetical protein
MTAGTPDTVVYADGAVIWEMTERTLKVKRHAVCVMCKDFE